MTRALSVAVSVARCRASWAKSRPGRGWRGAWESRDTRTAPRVPLKGRWKALVEETDVLLFRIKQPWGAQDAGGDPRRRPSVPRRRGSAQLRFSSMSAESERRASVRPCRRNRAHVIPTSTSPWAERGSEARAGTPSMSWMKTRMAVTYGGRG